MRKFLAQRFITAALAYTVACSIAIGATSSAWFGLPLPPPLSNPHRPVVKIDKHAPPAAIPAHEENNRELQGTRIFKDVKSIVGFSRKDFDAGHPAWGRITGFPSAQATIEWSAEQFKKAGLKDVQVQEYDAAANTTLWHPTKWEVRLLGNDAFGKKSHDVVLHSAVPASGSMMANGELTGELIDVGMTTDATLPNVDVRGKVAVQRLHPAAGAFSERTKTVERAQELTKRGAVAILNVVEQTGNMHIRDFGNCGAPCFNLGGADGAFVHEALRHAIEIKTPLTIRLQLTADKLAGLKGHNAVGIVPGKRSETLIVNAHADGWYDAAGDNADGLAVLLALARHFANAAHQPERTLIFVASGGHHSSGLNGPANFVRMNPALVANTVMVLNLEHIAQLRIKSDSWTIDPTEQPMNFGIDNSSPALIAIGKRGVERYGFNLNPEFGTSVSGDLGGYSPLGVARLQAIHSGPMYHASGDVLETISVPGLERAARFYAFFIEEAAKTAREQINPPRK